MEISLGFFWVFDQSENPAGNLKLVVYLISSQGGTSWTFSGNFLSLFFFWTLWLILKHNAYPLKHPLDFCIICEISFIMTWFSFRLFLVARKMLEHHRIIEISFEFQFFHVILEPREHYISLNWALLNIFWLYK